MGLKFYYFNSTHWDREWYQPLQTYRRYLVQTMAGVLDTLEKRSDFEKYTFDGQTIVLEDVVEIHPEWRERLRRQIEAGRLNVGPWYVMPDEFLISGESMIRNLLIGREVAEEFGGAAWPVGYICDIFGHTAQTPQIFKGFGLGPAVLWRGTDSSFPPYFFWESPDGTRCETIKLPSDSGYAGFSLWVTGWWNLPLEEGVFKERFKNAVERLRPYYGDAIVLSDALDHINVHAQAPEYLKWIKELYPDSEVIHSDYREALAEFSDAAALPVIPGELIRTADVKGNNTWMIPHTLSSRYDVKSGNDRCQNMLELDADPIQALQSSGGRDAMTAFWKYAWKQLIKNHPHDSICGCSIDAVHRQMLTRFEEIEQVGDVVVEDLVLADRERLTGKTVECFTHTGDMEDHGGDDWAEDGCYTLRVFNPLPWEREEVVGLELAFPTKKPYPEKWSEPFGYEFINSFKLFDADGGELEYQLGKLRRNQMRRFYRHDSRVYDVYPVAVRLKLRASGWNTVQVRPSNLPVRYFVSQLTSQTSAANEQVALAINADGSFDLYDKTTRRSYRKLNSFLIDREIGDGWNHVRPLGASTLVASLNGGSVALRADGPARTVFEITTRYELPRELNFEGTLGEGYAGISESADLATLTIRSLVTLDAGSDLVKVETTVDNRIKDYRLRLAMPTGIEGKYFAYQNFAVIEREAGRATGRGTENFMEAEPLEKNFSGIAGKFDGAAGLAFIARYGLHELSASCFEAGELYVTLLRAFRRTVATNGESDCQLLKPLRFEYAFKPMDSESSYAGLYRAAQNYRSTLPNHLVPAVETPEDASWIRLEGNLSLAALKPSQSGKPGSVIVRVLNLSDKPATGAIVLDASVRATPVRLDETACDEPQERTRRIEVEAAPWRLMTYQLEF